MNASNRDPLLLFETDRLRVRRVHRPDLDAIYEVYSDPLAMRWVGDGRPIKFRDCEKWLAVTETNYATRGYGLSALDLKRDGQTIGFCGIVHPGGQAEPEIKYALLPSFWGKGYATEAVAGMLRYGARAHGLRRIIATVASENQASRAVLRKSGLSPQSSHQETDDSLTLVYVWSPAAKAS